MNQFFTSTTNKGELQELQEDLNSTNFETKKEAVKKVIAYMTIGKDVSSIFQDVIKCLEHPQIELKKLVYLYIINYSRHKPEDAIMVINLFRRDINQGTPLIKALAVRTMGCLRVSKLNEYLCEPLKQALSDEDPYVRKTAVLCVQKVYGVNSEMIDSSGIIKMMQNMLSKEGNAFVMANLIQSLSELSQMKKKNLIKINVHILQKLLIAANECFEWGQVFILDCLTHYIPLDAEEALLIIERIIPRLLHINPSVVLSSIKLITIVLEYVPKNHPEIKNIYKKLSPSLTTLIGTIQPEVQYTILRNITFVIQKRPFLLEDNIKILFVKYNDPHYIKSEKLDILMKICNKSNYEIILNELKEYANDIDSEFVRKSIKAIGKICIMYDKTVDKCLKILIKLLKNSVEFVGHLVAEIIIVVQKIYRYYPKIIKQDEESLVELSKFFGKVDEKKAESAAIWIIGEYLEKIDNGMSILEAKSKKFLDYNREIQLQILTSSVKAFLKFPDLCENLITNLLETASSRSQCVDVRDRAYIYWRMLSSEPEKTKLVVISKKPPIIEEIEKVDNEFIDDMIKNMSSVSTVLHTQPEVLYENHFYVKFERCEENYLEIEEKNKEVNSSVKKEIPIKENLEKKIEEVEIEKKIIEEKNNNINSNIDLLDMDYNEEKTEEKMIELNKNESVDLL